MIPKIIHIIWIGKKKFPYRKEFKTWKQHNPTWEVKLWTDKNIPKLKNQELYNKTPHYAGKADILRIELLYKYGGVYTDADSFCLKSIDEVVKGHTLLVMRSKFSWQSRTMSNGFIAATKGHPAIEEAVNNFTQHITSLDEINVHHFGRFFLYPIFKKYPDFKVNDRNIIESSDKTFSPEIYMVHKNGNSWIQELGGVNITPFAVEPLYKKKKVAVIMAAGSAKRWGNYMGVPKQLIEVNGESLLQRTIRLLKSNGIVNIYLTVPQKGYYGKLGVKEIVGSSESEIDKFLNADKFAGAVFLWGDTFFTAEAMKIICENRKAPMFFGKCKDGQGIGRGWREIFAVNTSKEFFKKALKLKEYEPEMERCASWELYTYIAKGTIAKNKSECFIDKSDFFTEINDITDDFDYPKDYDVWMDNYEKLKRERLEELKGKEKEKPGPRVLGGKVKVKFTFN